MQGGHDVAHSALMAVRTGLAADDPRHPLDLGHHLAETPAGRMPKASRRQTIPIQEFALPMNGSRLLSTGVCMTIALGLGTAALAIPGCGPTSEGRPAGSIEVKNARSTPADVEAARAKARAGARSPRSR